MLGLSSPFHWEADRVSAVAVCDTVVKDSVCGAGVH